MSIEWTFPDGSKGTDGVRWLGGHCFNEFATYVHGTKCAAQFSGNIHKATTHIYKDQRCTKDNIVWETRRKVQPLGRGMECSAGEHSPRQAGRIEVLRAAQSNFADLMGREAIHSGQKSPGRRWLNFPFQFYPGKIDDLNYDSEPPGQSRRRRVLPRTVPGMWTET